MLFSGIIRCPMIHLRLIACLCNHQGQRGVMHGHSGMHTHTHPETNLLAINFQGPVMEEICSCWLCVFPVITGAEIFPDGLLPRHRSTDCSLWEHTHHSNTVYYYTFLYLFFLHQERHGPEPREHII